jgi:predicted glycosyltransferase
VTLFRRVVDELSSGGWDVVLTARDHANTAQLALRYWPEIEVIGGASPAGAVGKARSLAARAADLHRFARRARPDVALSHGSYAQVVAARAALIPAVTMMDYEHQPANHVSFRAATKVIVPDAFPAAALARFGAARRKVVRYAGFKEELYLAGFEPDPYVREELGIERSQIVAVLRPAPEGALYHRMTNDRFERMLQLVGTRDDVATVLLPRTADQAQRYAWMHGVVVPQTPIDAPSLLALADLSIGAGGTMNRESAILGTPTYTVFSGKLAAVDAELIRRGRLHDLRQPGTEPRFLKKPARSGALPASAAEPILAAIDGTLHEVTA